MAIHIHINRPRKTRDALKQGTRVRHPRYGKGSVFYVSGNKVEVQWDRGEVTWVQTSEITQDKTGDKRSRDSSLTSLSTAEVDQALRNSGYSDNGLLSVYYRGMSPSSGAIYVVSYRDPDGKDGTGKGNVYIKERDGKFYGEF